MQIRKLGTLGILAVALVMPGVSLAQNDTKTEKAAQKAAAQADRAAARAERAAAKAARAAARAEEKAEKTQHGIGKGGVPALRDALQNDIAGLDSRLEALEGQFVDDDGDTFSEVQNDCDDDDAAVNPLATEVAGNEIDDDCDHLIDEV